ncbi:hypothetical protein THOM_3141 [Trachipleistophora hominis]|uniref:Uncharacterized protein n=1 Tax=Trachipleistophora hominis TaxID=72359 RepID=L7JRM8_TRAHO|nr:hypothetical protein THOM_3141 [Trachipleistophora hominis]
MSERIDLIEAYAKKNREKMRKCRKIERVMIRTRNTAVLLCNKRLEYVIEENVKLQAKNIELKREALEVLTRQYKLKQRIEELEMKKDVYKKKIKQLENMREAQSEQSED